MCLMKVVGVLAISACLLPVVWAQAPPPPQSEPLLTPDQLDTLVAPIALYPDSLLSQILAASTYPLEIVELAQWLQQNPGLRGEDLMEGARNEGWDPSVAALAAFPDVVKNLNQDIRWTQDLGNAFLAQQGDVMDAVQRMRARAQANGRLQTNSQYDVSTDTQDGRSVIEIAPANPQIVYVPEYDPAWVWGAPAVGYYPPLWYPGVSVGFGFGSGIYIGSFFGGCCGWGGGYGWGWEPRWFDRQIYVNNNFMHRYGFHDYHGGAFRGADVWQHDPGHRWGVPYANHEVANRFRGGGFGGAGNFNRGFNGNGRQFGGQQRGFGGQERNFGSPQARAFGGGNNARGGFAGGGFQRAPTERFGSPGFERANPGINHSVFGGIHNGAQARIQSDHGFSSMRGFGGGGFRGGFGGARGGGFGGGGFHGGGGGFHGGGRR
jgi:hypothetical protein